jgi:hypothetical protein
MKKYTVIFAALLITTPMASQAFWKKPVNHPAMTCYKINPKTGEYEKVPCYPSMLWQKNSLSSLGK